LKDPGEREEDAAAKPRSRDADPAAPTPLRLLSLLAVGIVFVLYRPGAEATVLNTLVLPLLGLLAAWYLTHSLLVVALGVFSLSIAHADPAATGVLESRVYPALAVAAGLLLARILLSRFRRAVAERRAQRLRERAEDEGD